MENFETIGEVLKHFRISDFCNYSLSETICTNFHVIIDSLRSNWEAIVCPMCLDNSKLENLVNCDVSIELKCTYSNIPVKYLKDLTVHAVVRGRENYPVEIKKSLDGWKGILVSRIALQNDDKIREDDTFQFLLQFRLPYSILSKGVDSCLKLAVDLESGLKTAENFDICLITSSGSKFFVHSCVLDMRSNILKNSNRKSSLIKSEEFSEDDNNHCTSSSTEEQTYSYSSSSRSNSQTNTLENSDNATNIFIGSPLRRRTPLFMVSMETSPSAKKIRSTITARQSPYKNTPTKKSVLGSPISRQSPGTGKQTQLTNYFPRSSTFKSDTDDNYKTSPLLSPIAVKSPKKFLTPLKESKLHSVAALSPLCKENSSPSISERYFSPRELIRSPCGLKPTANFQSPKRKLSFSELDTTDSKKFTTITVNMSTSVTQEILMWIYTGWLYF